MWKSPFLESQRSAGGMNPGCQVLWATKSCTVMPTIYGFSGMEHVILLAPRVLKWVLDIWKMCAPLYHSRFRVDLDTTSTWFRVPGFIDITFRNEWFCVSVCYLLQACQKVLHYIWRWTTARCAALYGPTSFSCDYRYLVFHQMWISFSN